MSNRLLLQTGDKTSYLRSIGFAAITSGIMYLFIQQLLHNPGSNSLLTVFSALCLLVPQSYVKSIYAIDPEPGTTDEEEDACGGSRGEPTEDSDLPVADGGVE
jgi:hypothetical protein